MKKNSSSDIHLKTSDFDSKVLGSDYDPSSPLPNNLKFESVKEYYQNESLARNQLKNVLDKMTYQTSSQTKNSEDKMLMELYLNSKNNSGETSSQFLSSGNNPMDLLAASPHLSPFETRKAKINESMISDVSPADRVELEDYTPGNRLKKIYDKQRTRNKITGQSSHQVLRLK